MGHYTSAMFTEPNNATYPLNRAAAYLKLDKYDIFSFPHRSLLPLCVRGSLTQTASFSRYQDAERDCEKVLQLDPQNIKGLFRRAQAKAGTGKLTEAQAGARFAYCGQDCWFLIPIGYVDLLKVITIEPNNPQARQELDGIKARIAKVEGKKKVRPREYEHKLGLMHPTGRPT